MYRSHCNFTSNGFFVGKNDYILCLKKEFDDSICCVFRSNGSIILSNNSLYDDENIFEDDKMCFILNNNSIIDNTVYVGENSIGCYFYFTKRYLVNIFNRIMNNHDLISERFG